jgi:hypothetical protein
MATTKRKRSGQPSKTTRTAGTREQPSQPAGNGNVAKEDVNVPIPGKKPRSPAAPAKGRHKPPGKRLMDFTG